MSAMEEVVRAVLHAPTCGVFNAECPTPYHVLVCDCDRDTRIAAGIEAVVWELAGWRWDMLDAKITTAVLVAFKEASQ